MATKRQTRAKAPVKKPFQPKEYRTVHSRAGQTVILQTGRDLKLLHYDKEGNSRAIRHCLNQPSIFVDEQNDNAIVDPIVMEGGLYTAHSKITQAFLDASPQNAGNPDQPGMKWFEEINEEKEAEISIQRRELQIDLYAKVKEQAEKEDGVYDLEAEVAVLMGEPDTASKMSTAELKRALYAQIEENPFYFWNNNKITIFEDEFVLRKFLTLKAIKQGIINVSPDGKSVLWEGRFAEADNRTIYQAPIGTKTLDAFSQTFLASEDGALVLETIKKHMA